ncbi:Zinc-finger double-stranded RNA-binding family protein [Babesia bovis T2Bo]|uniref:Zinc finger double-stranded RNA binding domain-containing protein n=1 Tax=Babesia bovis TaxID=5865 RepID=A7ASU5_BABBO|nr:Zinc-finger double-stranded RNA-binding family protein [Babesia bovis T2Bo]EDO06006.1 Zinc-finger double-stranded RNA-binding family protein [Babesia bovis T2Bo]|eukprot:XP_001609574.1 hypothetical protein [Babesia bovis T2Bo]
MFKRAYLYACTAPTPNADVNEEGDVTPTTLDSETETKNISKRGIVDEQISVQKIDDESHERKTFITFAPKGKVAMCKACKGKTMLNENSIDKHLNSKAHKRKVKMFAKDTEDADKTRKEFLKRMESVENRMML